MKKFNLTIALVLIITMPLLGCNKPPVYQRETRACWVSTIGNLDFPSKPALKAEQLQEEINEIVMNCRKIGLNTIFFQVRPSGDALYKSSIFPWSAYLSGKQGTAPDKLFDPLEYFVKEAHENSIELHAWINPYRIGTAGASLDSLSDNNPARIHPEYAVVIDSGIYYNPGLPEVRKLVLDGVSELVSNYDIDGIHFDDYFYPYEMAGFEDQAAFAAHGSGMNLSDYRRNAVDRLIESAYTLIKTMDDSVRFGISPFGIWANRSEHSEGSETNGLSAYYDIYSDSKKWVERHWVDYICPQIYWSDENPLAPFSTLVDWWDRICLLNEVDLYIGIAVYKVGTNEAGWEDGDIIRNQLVYAASKEAYAGHSFFRYGILMENRLGTQDAISEYYGRKDRQ